MLGANHWLIGINIVAKSNFGLISTQISRQAFASQRSISGLNTSFVGMGRTIEGLRASAIGLGTALSGAFATAGLAAIGTAASDAARLQQTLLSIKNETGASNSQLGRFYNSAFAIANTNGMTPLQGGEILRTISRLTAGQFSVDKMLTVAPMIADYASKVHFNRPDVSVETATRTGIQTAHLFQAYQPSKLAKLLDLGYRLSGLMSESPDAALRQMSYYVPLFKALKIGDETSIGMMALLDRAGFRNKVGTNVRALALESLGPLQLTSHAQHGKMGILTEMGLFKDGKFAFNTANGGLDFNSELLSIANWAQKEVAAKIPMSKIAEEMVGALGKQGATVGALFLNSEMPGILEGLRRYVGDPNVGLGAATKNRDGSMLFQFSRATSAFTSVMTELGYPWLTDLTKFFEGIADNVHGFQVWLHNHRDAEKQIGEVVAGITALAAVRLTVGTGQAIFGAAKALKLFGDAGPDISFSARALTMLDWVFLGGMGGQAWAAATKLGLFGAVINSFAGLVGGSAVAGVPLALRSLGATLLGLVAPLALVTTGLAAFAGIMLLTAKQAGGSDENTIRAGGPRRYGSRGWWENYGRVHGWNSLPTDISNQLHLMHARDAAHGQTHVDVGGVHVHVHVPAGIKDAHRHGQIIGATVAHELAKAGLIRHSPLGPGLGGNAVPATA